MSDSGCIWMDADFRGCMHPIGDMTDELSLSLPSIDVISMDELIKNNVKERFSSADCIFCYKNRVIFTEFKKWSSDEPDSPKKLDDYLKSVVCNKVSDSFGIYMRCLRNLKQFLGKNIEFWLVTDCPR